MNRWIKSFFALVIFSIGSTGYSGELHCIPAFPEQITRGAKSPFAFCDEGANSYNQLAIRHGSISRVYAVDATDNGIGPNSCTIKFVVNTFFPDKNPHYNGHYELVTSFTTQKLTCYCLNNDCNVRPTLSLLSVSSLDPLPKGISGKDSSDFVAKINDGTRPKAGVAIQFTVVVTAGSGGHDHHDPSRPHGTLSALQGTSDANGEVKITFTAPQVAGIHTIKATCSTCSNSSVSQEIKVKVPDLVPISPNSPINADGTYAYALTSVDTIHAGEGRYHKNQYYLTEQAQQNLLGLITSFAAAGWGTVALNDASLYWGGRYDIKGNWGEPHRGHRDGREIDISFKRANNPISKAKQNAFYKKFCEDKAVNAAFSILHHFVAVAHFHVYLENQKACNRTEK